MWRSWLILFFFIWLVSSVARAEYEFTYNIVNIHTFARSENFANKVDRNGIIMTNPFTTIRKDNLGLIAGVDSVGDFVYGVFYYKDINENWSFLLGGYSFDKAEWDKAESYNNIAEALGFVPVGVIRYKKDIDENWSWFGYTSGIVSGAGISFRWGKK